MVLSMRIVFKFDLGVRMGLERRNQLRNQLGTVDVVIFNSTTTQNDGVVFIEGPIASIKRALTAALREIEDTERFEADRLGPSGVG